MFLSAHVVVTIGAGATQAGAHNQIFRDGMPTGAFNHFNRWLCGSAFGHYPFVGIPTSAVAIPVGWIVSEFSASDQSGNNLAPGHFAVLLTPSQKFFNAIRVTVNPCAIAQLILQSQIIHFSLLLFGILFHRLNTIYAYCVRLSRIILRFLRIF
jgi:hypothetical protein